MMLGIKMNKKIIGIFLCGFVNIFTLQIAYSENKFQHEIYATFTSLSTDSDIDTKIGTLGFQTFLNPISEGDYPLAESTFAARQPYLAALYGIINRKISSDELSGELYAWGGGIANKNFPLFLEYFYIKSNESIKKFGYISETNIISKEVSLGIFVTDMSSVKMSYGKSSYKSDNLDRKNYGVQIKRIFSLGNSNYINLEVASKYFTYTKNTKDENTKALGLILDYYLSKSFGFGIGGKIFKNALKISDSNSINFHVINYIAPLISVNLGFEKNIENIGNFNGQAFTIGLAVRL